MIQHETTRNLLLSHYKSYPRLQIQDIFKFLYQSVFGCEHFVSSVEKATELILREYRNIPQQHLADAEVLDGNYARVPLSYISRGLSADTLGKLFFLSAKKEENAHTTLTEKIEIAKGLILENLLPFSKENFEKEVAQWSKDGFVSIHHSDIFKQEYCPSYRVIAKEYIPFLPLLAELDKTQKEKNMTIAIEGPSASGKTTLSKLLEKLYPCTVFHMDDFFLQPEQRTPQRYAQAGGNIDRERFLSEVLQPLSTGHNITYRKFDCSSMTLGKKEQICPKKLVVVEGAYSMHPELEKYYDLSVFLDISPNLQQERILRRNTPDMAQRFFECWIPLENTYFKSTLAKERCNITIPVEE